MNSLLGVTIQCARCHKHKFEPIRHQEYYQLQAIFFPAYNPERWSPPKDRIVEVGAKKDREEWKRRNDLVDRQIKALNGGLPSVQISLREQFLYERLKDVALPMRDKIIQTA